MEFIAAVFSDHTLRTVMLGSIILGLSAGSLGVFAVLRQQSLLGDAIAHATLPGICIAFMLTGQKTPLILLLGAGIAGWLGTLLIKIITEQTQLKKDAALGIILSVFFGFGLALLTVIQRFPTATKAGLDKFLFGNASTLLREDIVTMGYLGVGVLIILIFCWKEFKIVVFDQDFAKSLGLRIHFIDILLTTLIVIAIVIGLQTTGVVLMSAMLVAPAAAARQWTDRLGHVVILAAFIGAVSGSAGSLTSSIISHLPTGPTIVLFLSTAVFFSLIFAPHRGLLWDWLREYHNRKKMLTTTMLKNLLLFSEISTDPFHPHDIAALRAIGKAALMRTMHELLKKGWVTQFPDKRWALTPTGLSQAKSLTQEFEDQIFEI